MTISTLRTSEAWWVQTASGAVQVDSDAVSTGELLADRAAIDAAAHGDRAVPLESLQLISPERRRAASWPR